MNRARVVARAWAVCLSVGVLLSAGCGAIGSIGGSDAGAPASSTGAADEKGGDPADIARPSVASEQPGSTAIVLSGSVSGEVADAVVDCRGLESIGAWSLTGTLNGEPVDLTFNTNSFQGAATYAVTSISDADAGLMTLTVGELPDATAAVVSNGATPGTFTVDDGIRSGSVDAVLQEVDQEVDVDGTWTCDD